MILILKNQAEWTKAEDDLRLKKGDKGVYLYKNFNYQTIHMAGEPLCPCLKSEYRDGLISDD